MIKLLSKSEAAKSPTTTKLATRRVGRGKPSRRVVVVGNGPVGWKFCDLLSQAGDEQFSITVFGEEPEPAYDRVHLTEILSHRDPLKLELASREWYESRGITLATGDPVVEVDTKIKRIRTDSGQIAFYDTLILATGSRPFVPPIPGIDLPGVHLYRTLKDMVGIANDVDRLAESLPAKAAVIGGGLLGLEAARALHDAGIETHVFEVAAVLMPKQLDGPAAELLQREIESLGVHVHTLSRTSAIEQDNDQLRLILAGEDEHPSFDTIIVSAGIRPRDDLAREGGLTVDQRGGIIVSDKLQTSNEDVYAIGECVVHNDTVYGLVAPGFHMAGVLAERLRSKSPIKPTFRGHDNATRLKLMGVDVITLGDFLQVDSTTTVVTHSTDSTYRKLILRGTRVVGATIVGSCDELARLSESVEAKRRVGRRAIQRFVEHGHLWDPDDAHHVSEWPAAATVCSCLQVDRGTLTKACESGCETVDCLIKQTGASTVCGSCRPLLAELVGSPETAGGVAGWRMLGGVSIAALIAALIGFVVVPQEFATSMQAAQAVWDRFLLNDFWKQVTGYVLVGLSLVAVTLSLRKRWGKLTFGTYGFWRVFHSMIGLACLFGLILHTGLHFGANLNLGLMVSFLGTLLVGAVTGVITSAESKAGKPPPRWVKAWRPRLTWLHVLLTWPLPVLVAFHILAFYMHAD